MKIKNLITTLFVLALALTGCSDDDCDLRHPDQLLGLPALKQGTFPETDLNLKVGETYDYAPVVNSQGDVYYQWYLGEEDMSTEPRFSFTASRPTRSKVVLELANDYGKVTLENRIIVPGADYTKGCLIVNEGWFGHEPGSVSYYDYSTNKVEQWAYKNQNFGATLGVTSQSATLWNGKLYICSKEKTQIAIVDPKTLYAEKSGAVLPNGRQAYEFIGLNEQYGLITANADVYRVDLKTLKAEQVMMSDTWGGCGSGVVYQGKLLLNVKGKKVHVIDMEKLLGDLSKYGWSNYFPFETLDIQTTGGCRFVTAKDGNVYTIETDKNGNSLVKIKPDLTIEKTPVRSDYSPSSFGAYREASFCAVGDVFYYIAGGKIYKCTFADAAPEKPFNTYHKEGYSFYGAGLRVNPVTGELIATYLTSDYKSNLIVRFDGSTGNVVSELSFDGYYFPGTIIFN